MMSTERPYANKQSWPTADLETEVWAAIRTIEAHAADAREALPSHLAAASASLRVIKRRIERVIEKLDELAARKREARGAA